MQTHRSAPTRGFRFVALAVMLVATASALETTDWAEPVPRLKKDWFSNPLRYPVLGSGWVAGMTFDDVLILDSDSGDLIKSLKAGILAAPSQEAAGAKRTITSWSGPVAASDEWVVAAVETQLGIPNVVNLGLRTSLCFYRMDGSGFLKVVDLPTVNFGSVRCMAIDGDECVILDETPNPDLIRRFSLTTGVEQASAPLPVSLSSGPFYPRRGFSGGALMGAGLSDGVTGIHVVPVDGSAPSFIPFPGSTSSSTRVAYGGDAALAVVSTTEGRKVVIVDLGSGETVLSEAIDDPEFSSVGFDAFLLDDGKWGVMARNSSKRLWISGDLNVPGSTSKLVLPIPVFSGTDPLKIADGRDGRVLLTGDPDDFTAWAYELNATLPRRTGGLVAEPACESKGTIRLEITLDPPPLGDLWLELETADGSARLGQDYAMPPAGVWYPAGAASIDVGIPLVSDRVVEENEWFAVTVRDPQEATIWVPPVVHAVIEGSSFIDLPPEKVFDPGPSGRPWNVGLAGGMLVQLNQGNDASVPAVVTKPLGVESWAPSVNWGQTAPQVPTYFKYRQSDSGRALITYDQNLSIYDPVSDQLVFRWNPAADLRDSIALRGNLLLTEGPANSQVSLFDLGSPSTPRFTLPYTPWEFTLAGDRVVVQNAMKFEAYAVANKAFLGDLFPAGTFFPSPGIDGDGDFLLLTATSELKASIANLASGDAPAPVRMEGTGAVWDPKLRNGVAFIPRKSDEAVWVDVVEAESGVVLGKLHSQWITSLPSGVPDVSSDFDFYYELYPRCFSIDGNETLLHTEVHSFSYPDSPGVGHFLSHAKIGSPYPGFVDGREMAEGQSEEFVLQFAEATDEPLVLTIRPFGSGRETGWTREVNTVTLPAGETRVATGFALVDDGQVTGDARSAFEIRVEGSAGPETRLATVLIRDDDQWHSGNLSVGFQDFVRETAEVGGVWFGPVWVEGATEAYIGSTLGDALKINSPLPGAGLGGFGSRMEGEGPYLAVTHQAWSTAAGRLKASGVYVYRPHLSTAPYLAIAGKTYPYRFGDALHISGDSLWVGAPGNGDIPDDGLPAGYVVEYNLLTRKSVKVFSPPSGMGRNFGADVVCSDDSIWIWSERATDKVGFVQQYDRTTRAWIRSIEAPTAWVSAYPGRRIDANRDLLVMSGPGTSTNSTYPSQLIAVDGDGVVRWTMTAPPLPYWNDFEFVTDNILAVASRNAVTFFEIDGFLPPRPFGSYAVDYAGPYATRLFAGEHGLAFSDPVASPPSGVSILDLREIPAMRKYVGFPDEFLPASTVMTGAGIRLGGVPGESCPGVWLEGPLKPVEGSTLKVVSSPDLSDWSTAAYLDDTGRWQLRGDLAVDWFLDRGNGTLCPPDDAMHLFFRYDDE